MADVLLAHIGKTIRALRKEKNISIEEVAFAAKISYVYFSQIERGQRNLTIKALYQIAAALGVEPAVLLPNSKRRVSAHHKAAVIQTMRQLMTQIRKL